MGEVLRTESNLVEQYLHIACFNKISDSIFRDMLDYEAKADPIEKKLIKRIRHQVERGKLCCLVPIQKNCDNSTCDKEYRDLFILGRGAARSIRG